MNDGRHLNVLCVRARARVCARVFMKKVVDSQETDSPFIENKKMEERGPSPLQDSISSPSNNGGSKLITSS